MVNCLNKNETDMAQEFEMSLETKTSHAISQAITRHEINLCIPVYSGFNTGRIKWYAAWSTIWQSYLIDFARMNTYSHVFQIS